MPDIKRVVNTAFWDDEKVINDFSPEDKYFMLYLLTNKHTTQLGIYKFVPKQVGYEMGYSQEAVLVLLDRFENKYKILKYSKETNEVAIRNYLFHSIVSGGKPVYDCLLKEERDVINRELLWYTLEGMLRKQRMLPGKINATVASYIDHLKEERTKEERYFSNPIDSTEDININDNDNDNERYVHESYHESYHESSDYGKPVKQFIPPTIEEIRNYCTEKGLTNVNPERFFYFYESNGWKVGKNKMKNWHMAASGWNTREQSARSTKSSFDREAWINS